MTSAAAAGRRTLFLFAFASLAAVGAGAAILAAAGLPAGSWLRNPIAWAVGAGLGAALHAGGRARPVPAAFLILAPLGLAATLLAEPVDGVRRWIDLGPLHVNVAALLLPPAVVALGLMRSVLAMTAAAAAIALLLVLQPDASQATAFAAAAAFLFLRARLSLPLRLGAAALLAAACVFAWLRPDPLQPVREVEEIFALGLATAPHLAALAALALAVAVLTPLRLAPGGEAGDAAIALAIYFAVAALAPFAGVFPVPLVGLGMSFPVGWWLGVALLSARRSA